MNITTSIRKHLLFLTVAFFSLSMAATAEVIDFYETMSQSSNTEMISMTTDLFYNQIQSLSGYTVNDLRPFFYEPQRASSTSVSFYAQIEEGPGGSWICTLNAIKGTQGKNFSVTKTYESYYLILMDAKDSIQNVLENVSSARSQEVSHSSQGSSSQGISTDLEALSGSWSGGRYIDKIVILRGGRGFVIFKNGASMDISISIRGTAVTVVQTGKSNASFFPELNREAALKSAPTAKPIKWDFVLIDNNTLKGTQTTLISDDSSETGASIGTVNAEWTRK